MSIFDKEITQKLQQQIRTIPNFPIEGIMFRDITPLLNSGEYLNMVTNMFVDICNHYGWTPDYIVGPEARGFIFGPLLAAKLGVGFIPIRKPGKLPSSTIQIEYSLEYGSNILEMHDDAISEGSKVIIIDDLLATGGTVDACVKLCQQQGAEVIGNLFVIELEGLGARDKLSPIPCESLLLYPA
jgi:adenine phosphoribosyltransferase|tara:strand:+ start:2850 stop:3401 length:552 start_codon:yes stop_codon:yes gene_type:complete